MISGYLSMEKSVGPTSGWSDRGWTWSRPWAAGSGLPVIAWGSLIGAFLVALTLPFGSGEAVLSIDATCKSITGTVVGNYWCGGVEFYCNVLVGLTDVVCRLDPLAPFLPSRVWSACVFRCIRLDVEHCNECVATPGCGFCLSTMLCSGGDGVGPSVGPPCPDWIAPGDACPGTAPISHHCSVFLLCFGSLFTLAVPSQWRLRALV